MLDNVIFFSYCIITRLGVKVLYHKEERQMSKGSKRFGSQDLSFYYTHDLGEAAFKWRLACGQKSAPPGLQRLEQTLRENPRKASLTHQEVRQILGSDEECAVLKEYWQDVRKQIKVGIF